MVRVLIQIIYNNMQGVVQVLICMVIVHPRIVLKGVQHGTWMVFSFAVTMLL